jgi:hypothetical protein
MTNLDQFLAELNSPNHLKVYVVVYDLDISIDYLIRQLKDFDHVKRYYPRPPILATPNYIYLNQTQLPNGTITHFIWYNSNSPALIAEAFESINPDALYLFWITPELYEDLATLAPELAKRIDQAGGIFQYNTQLAFDPIRDKWGADTANWVGNKLVKT